MIRIRQMIAPPIIIRRLKICFLFRLCARIQAGECCLYSSLWSLWVLGSLWSLGPLDPLWSLSLFMSVFSLFYFIRIYQDATTGSAPKWCRTLICIGYDYVISFQLRYFYKISSVCIRQLFIISVPECLVKNAGQQKFTLLKLTLLASKMDLQKFSLPKIYFFNFFICSGPLLLPFFRDPTALFRLSQGIQDAPAKS